MISLRSRSLIVSGAASPISLKRENIAGVKNRKISPRKKDSANVSAIVVMDSFSIIFPFQGKESFRFNSHILIKKAITNTARGDNNTK
jgi:hypothetical protein